MKNRPVRRPSDRRTSARGRAYGALRGGEHGAQAGLVLSLSTIEMMTVVGLAESVLGACCISFFAACSTMGDFSPTRGAIWLAAVAASTVNDCCNRPG